MAKITVVGVGYIGSVTAACFADLGNEVVGLDIDQRKIDLLRQGKTPIYEPGLEEMVGRNLKAGRLSFTTSYAEAVDGAEFIFMCVDTPSGDGGEADLKYVRMAARQIGESLDQPVIIVNRSTVPIGTGDIVAGVVRKHLRGPVEFSVVSNPEFTREGSAIQDFLNPDRIILGSGDPRAAQRVAELYLPLRAPTMVTDIRTAELIKYASNAFLATRISFINEIATICEKLGADVKEVADGMGFDKRIGRGFLDAGIGFGGSCFPKDVRALEYMASLHGAHPGLLRAVMDINRDQRRRAVSKLKEALGDLSDRQIAVLGLSFKPNTDDMREAPSLEIIHLLQNEGAAVRAYDPVAGDVAGQVLRGVTLCRDAYQAASGADALVIVTEWNEFKQLDLERLKKVMRTPVIVDGRNIYEPAILSRLGFAYYGVGRGPGPGSQAVQELQLPMARPATS